MTTAIYTPKKTEVETSTGKFLDMADPQPESIDLQDIAHSLGNICRYNGHCKNFYSVAEHAVAVSKRLERKGYGKLIQLAGLHHDDTEAFLGDIPRPLKPLLGQAYVNLTDAIDAVVCEGLGLPFGPEAFHWKEVKESDDWNLRIEATHLLPSQGKGWLPLSSTETKLVVPDYYLNGISPAKAKKLYLDRHSELTR